jgi:hypothetical protein
MNDSLTAKQLVLSGLTAADFTGSEVFSRIHSPNANSHLRGCTLTPTSGDVTKLTLRVSHNTSDKSLTRSVFALEYEIQRRALGAAGNYDQPTGVSTVGVIALRADIPPTLSVTEYNAMAARLIGLLTENNGALLASVFNRET